MTGKRKINVMELEIVAKSGDFFKVLDAIKRHLGINTLFFTRDLITYCSGGEAELASAHESTQACNKLKEPNYKKIGIDNLNRIISLFERLADDNQAVIKIIRSLREMRLTPLKEAETMQELVKAVREYSGLTINSMHEQTNMNLATLKSLFGNGKIFTNPQSQELKEFLLKKHPELKPFLNALGSLIAFRDFKENQTSKQTEPAQATATIPPSCVVLKRYELSGDIFVSQAAESWTISM